MEDVWKHGTIKKNYLKLGNKTSCPLYPFKSILGHCLINPLEDHLILQGIQYDLAYSLLLSRAQTR